MSTGSTVRDTKPNAVDRFVAGLLFALTISCALVVIFEFARWTYDWLRFGESADVSLTSLIGEPRVEWVGVQKVISLFWNLDVAYSAILLMFISGWAWGQLTDQTGRQQ